MRREAPSGGSIDPRYQRSHAMKRFRERYGVEMQGYLYDALTMRLRRFIEGEPREDVERTYKPRVFFVRCGNGEWLLAAWDHGTMQIGTFLPLSASCVAFGETLWAQQIAKAKERRAS